VVALADKNARAAKHLIGLAAANYAVGPGRKKRSQVEAFVVLVV